MASPFTSVTSRCRLPLFMKPAAPDTPTLTVRSSSGAGKAVSANSAMTVGVLSYTVSVTATMLTIGRSSSLIITLAVLSGSAATV